MMTLPAFEYVAPDTVEEACTLLTEADGSALLAGGSDLMVQMKQRTVIPKLVVGLKRLGLQEIEYSDQGGLTIGAMVTLGELAANKHVQEHYPVLVDAANYVGATQHQAMGTVGGNVCLDTRCWYYNQSANWRRSLVPCHKLGGKTCHALKGAKKCYAVYSADVGAALTALGASVTVVSRAGEREVALRGGFFSGDPVKPNSLNHGELITRVSVPPQKFSFYRYYKLRTRGAIDFPLLGVILMSHAGGKDFRMVVNAVAGSPLYFPELEERLDQEGVSESLVNDVVATVVSRVRPVANVYGSPAYRRKMAGMFLAKAFKEMGIG